MTHRPHIYIIGGGFGGIAAALRMRKKNYKVTVLERGNQLGGRARVFKQDGFSFDAGPTVITAPYLINELFEMFDKNPDDYINLKPLEHWYRYVFQDGSTFDYVNDEKQLLENIEKIAPGDSKGFKKLLALSQVIFQKGFVDLSCEPFLTIPSMIKQLPALLKIKFYRSVYAVVSRHIKSEKLRKVFTTQPLLVGGNPFKTTSIYLLILYLEKEYGCHFSMGGTHGIIKGLTRLMQEVGIEIRYESTVTSIQENNKQLKALCINDQEILPCDMAIYNGDPAYAYQNLVAKKSKGSLYNLRLNSIKYSMGLCVFYFGTNRTYDEVPLHTIIYGKAYKELLNDIFNKLKLNLDLSLYLYRPTAVDKSLAPEGCDGFYVLAPVPNLLSGIDWSKMQEMLKQHIIGELEKRILKDLSKHIITEKFVTPEYFSSELLSQHGAGFSLQPLFTQSAYFRFHNQSNLIRGLYFVGAGTHPGAGVPGVLSSAKIIDKLIPRVSNE